MAVTLQDPTRQRDPSSRHAFPGLVGEQNLRAARTFAEQLLSEFEAEISAHGRPDVPVAHGEAETR